ncbi:MAG TPA: iron-sulfur cluster assembly scaffold protein [Candidatus Absconditabacterales bacterium]|nr:iron-sulfur cluster assembly scaffold protein [Candidatus Absconditabacterales bacterium]
MIFGTESNEIIKEYSKNPVSNFEMKDFTVKYHEGNFICGDDITVFLKINKNKIDDYSYVGNTSTVSLASAGFLSEFLIGKKIDEVLKWDYGFLVDNGLEVSNKRKRAAILPILAVRNAIHEYLDDKKVDDFDDLIEE